jgi:hypothetical protein
MKEILKVKAKWTGEDEPAVSALGRLLSRHNGAVLHGTQLSRFTASGSPWMVLEVREHGIAVRQDPRLFSRARRLLNVALTPLLRPSAILGMDMTHHSSWTSTWADISNIRSPARKVLAIESSRSTMEFRFGSGRGLWDSMAKIERSRREGYVATRPGTPPKN